jgi:hypothetical protein
MSINRQTTPPASRPHLLSHLACHASIAARIAHVACHCTQREVDDQSSMHEATLPPITHGNTEYVRRALVVAEPGREYKHLFEAYVHLFEAYPRNS